MQREHILKNPPFKECHASTLVELANGNILAAWFAGTKEKHNDVAIWGAIRYPNGWSQPIHLAKVNNQPHWNPVLFRGSGNIVYLYFKIGNGCSYWRTMVMKSIDDGQTWSDPEEMVPGNLGGRGPVKNKCIELSDGTWLAPASSEIGRWQAFVDRSSDFGKNWERTSLINMPKKIVGKNPKTGKDERFGVIQPTLWESTPGNVHMLLRSTCGHICRSDSTDYGKTWCKVYETDMPNNNSGLDLAKLSDGSLLLAYNPVGQNWGDRYPIDLALSEDNGLTWNSIPVDVEKREYSYPAVIALADGGAAVTYTWGRKNMVFVRLNKDDVAAMKKGTLEVLAV